MSSTSGDADATTTQNEGTAASAEPPAIVFEVASPSQHAPAGSTAQGVATAATATANSSVASTRTEDSSSPSATAILTKMRIRGWPTVLHKLISEEETEGWHTVIQRIKDHPEEVPQSGKAFMMTPLHQICYRQPNVEVIQLLLEVHPGAAAAQNTDGETPLHIAAATCDEEVLALLLKDSPSSLVRADKYGDTPLLLAAGGGCSAEFLKEMLCHFPPNTAHVLIHQPNQSQVTAFSSLGKSYVEADTREELFEQEYCAEDWKKANLFLYHSALHASVLSLDQVPGCALSSSISYRLKESDKLQSQSPLLSTWRCSDASCNPLHLACRMNAPHALIETLSRLYPEWCVERDAIAMGGTLGGCTPLHYAATAPVWIDVKPPVLDMMDELHEPQPQEPTAQEEFNDGWSDMEEDDTTTMDDGGGGKMPAKIIPPSAPSVVDLVVFGNRDAAHAPDVRGRLSLALALETGKDLDEGPRSIILANPRVLDTRDVATNMYPFMIAAAGDIGSNNNHHGHLSAFLESPFLKEGYAPGKRPSLSTVYELIRALPELIAMGVPQQSSTNTTPVAEDNRKRKR
jgi:hypothetical protein